MLQVFNNLLKNAIQAIPAGEQGEVVVNLTQAGESVVVEIKDNGTGISPEMENQLFQPNFTTKTSGTGLGLAIVKNIVEEFGGAIWFKSEPGKGSSFFVSMPVYKDFERDV
jgi:signal transduction histidine kinase